MAMTSLASPADPRILVADTSAIINLLATGCAGRILRALPNRVVVTYAVKAELEVGRSRGRGEADLLAALIADDSLGEVRLNDRGARNFERLVIGPAHSTLDDGEAATIAYGAQSGATAVIDDRKAIRICRDQFPSVALLASLDLLTKAEIVTEIGESALADAVFRALYEGRMRVPEPHLEWVLAKIGPTRAAMCSSLPRSTRSSAPRVKARR